MPCKCLLLAYAGLWQLASNTPRTVTFSIETWDNHSWGLHNIERGRASGTVAVFADGSRANQFAWTRFQHYFIARSTGMIHTIYQRPPQLTVTIDDQTKTATIAPCGCSWQEPPENLPDAQCAAAARGYLRVAVTRTGSDSVAGIPVIRYRATSGVSHEVALAPASGCDLLEERRTTYNWFGIPTSHLHFIVRSYALGEPRRDLLDPPAGYAVRDRSR